MKKIDPSRFQEPKRSTPEEVEYRIELEDYFTRSIGSNVEKLQNFTKYVPVQDLRRFVCRYEIFKKILHVHGSIVECGVFLGGGLMSFAQLSEIFEPFNHLRNIIGFDTFTGFASVSDNDKRKDNVNVENGGLSIDSYEDLLEDIKLFDKNRVLSHIEKVRLVKGDIKETLPKYLEERPYTVVSLLYMDFDIFEPTAFALKHLIPRIPKGGIIAFDELNHETWPGETLAVIQELGLNNLRLERFPFGSTVSYAIIE